MGLSICDKVNRILMDYKYAFVICINTKIKVVSRVPINSIELLVLEGRFDYKAILSYIYDHLNDHPIEFSILFRQIWKEMEYYDENHGED